MDDTGRVPNDSIITSPNTDEEKKSARLNGVSFDFCSNLGDDWWEHANLGIYDGIKESDQRFYCHNGLPNAYHYTIYCYFCKKCPEDKR